MERHGRSLVRRVALIAGVLLLARPPSVAARAQELAEARQRWGARPFSRYRLVMQAPSWCRLDIEIASERVVQVFENSCPGGPRTVSDLFDQIRQLDSQPDTIYCAPAGCECTEVRFVQADYDAQLGFPRSIRLRRLRTTNWPELWHFMVAHGLPDCLPPLDLDVVNVLSLHPLS